MCPRGHGAHDAAERQVTPRLAARHLCAEEHPGTRGLRLHGAEGAAASCGGNEGGVENSAAHCSEGGRGRRREQRSERRSTLTHCYGGCLVRHGGGLQCLLVSHKERADNEREERVSAEMLVARVWKGERPWALGAPRPHTQPPPSVCLRVGVDHACRRGGDSVTAPPNPRATNTTLC